MHAASPTQTAPIISPSKPGDSSDLLCNYNTSDADNDSVQNITVWYRNNASTLLLYLPFGNNSKDYSISHGATTPSVNATWQATGGLDGRGAYYFNGTGGIATSLTYNFVNWTVTAWVNVPAGKCYSDGANAVIAKSQEYRIYLDSSCTVAGASRSDPANVTRVVNSVTKVNTSKWTHIAYEYDSSLNMSFIYINGLYKANQTQNGTTDSTNAFFVGSRIISTGFFNGTIDEVRVYNETLSAAQIWNEMWQTNTTHSLNIINQSQTGVGDWWHCEVTPNDGTTDGTALNSSAVLVTNGPTIPTVYSPTNGYYSGLVPINYSESESPAGISYYNISLFNIDETFNSTILANNSLNLSYLWNSTGTSDGAYLIRVEAFDNNNLSSHGYSANFTIDNSAPSYSAFANNASNVTMVGGVVNWSVVLHDNAALYTYVFYQNSTGSWVASGSGISGTTVALSKFVTMTLPGYVCGYFYLDDEAGNNNLTGMSCFNVSAMAEDYGNYSICPSTIILGETSLPCVVPLVYGSNCAELTTIIYNSSGIVESSFAGSYNAPYDCAALFNQTRVGAYSVLFGDGTIRELVVEEDKMTLGIIIMLPMLLSAVFIGIAAILSQEHQVLKLFLFLASIVPFFASAHLALISLVNYYDVVEFQDAIGTVTYASTIFFVCLVIYFILYLISWSANMAHDRKNKELEY